jgi:hypothetical protein
VQLTLLSTVLADLVGAFLRSVTLLLALLADARLLAVAGDVTFLTAVEALHRSIRTRRGIRAVLAHVTWLATTTAVTSEPTATGGLAKSIVAARGLEARVAASVPLVSATKTAAGRIIVPVRHGVNDGSNLNRGENCISKANQER